jgi:hypothetical protein
MLQSFSAKLLRLVFSVFKTACLTSRWSLFRTLYGSQESQRVMAYFRHYQFSLAFKLQEILFVYDSMRKNQKDQHF